ncbi:hypothetical protein [Limosilactobacillus reuteri]|uniref:hypothetical protein n=1 Tax=Limosilactobacillus reuteri TaxID=1598 RepID=UPI001E5A9911|nr:hypothetical protein [Limosilactobacillus reuteri]MCC4499975.1 hypothetical protein [Limosilactobacillus reuteri]MCC4499988.1 hypothetical protein [Limosilactobacillus reuteri]MCC4499996.1 hypothetical protein [Limosilactobacillus reuteri]MCC4500353.1 hypothetical protein [Limosilactobacillus reuteri]MCC4504309.1 hypothetical protein [Limosilactobacillus reuteri]
MSEFKLPHVEDLNTDRLLPGQLTEDMKAIQQEFTDLRGEIDSEEQDRKSEDNKLNGRIDATNTRIDNLDKQKATHDDLQAVRSELQHRINHLYAGDPRTIKTVVKEILEEKGVI